jgi:hypothetical protein
MLFRSRFEAAGVPHLSRLSAAFADRGIALRPEPGHWVAELPAWEERLLPALALMPLSELWRERVRIERDGQRWACRLVYWNRARAACHALLAGALALAAAATPELDPVRFGALFASAHFILALSALPGWLGFLQTWENGLRAQRPR